MPNTDNSDNKKLILIDFDETITSIHVSGLIRRSKRTSITANDLLIDTQKQHEIWQKILSPAITTRGNCENNNEEWRHLFHDLINSGYEVFIITYSEFPFAIEYFMREIIQLEAFYRAQIKVIYGTGNDYYKSHISRARELANKNYSDENIYHVDNEIYNIDIAASLNIQTLHLPNNITEDPITLIREKVSCCRSITIKPCEENAQPNQSLVFVRFDATKNSINNRSFFNGFSYLQNPENKHLIYSEKITYIPKHTTKKVSFNLSENNITLIPAVEETKPPQKNYTPQFCVGLLIGAIIGAIAFIFPVAKLNLATRLWIAAGIGFVSAILSVTALIHGEKCKKIVQNNQRHDHETIEVLNADNQLSHTLNHHEEYIYVSPFASIPQQDTPVNPKTGIELPTLQPS